MKKNLIPILISFVLFSVACHKTGEAPKSVPATDSLKVGLVAYYPFTGNVIDSSGNNNNGTATNLTSLADRYNKANAAYYFNGSNAYASVPDKGSLRLNNTDFTLNFWIKLDNYSLYGNNVLAKHLSGDDLGWVIGINGTSAAIPGAVHFGPGGSSASAVGTKPIVTNQWHMVTATYRISTEQLSIFVDGVLDNVTNNIPSPSATVASMLYIGRDEPTASIDGYFVKGGIDEVRIYNRVLPQAQITKLYLPAPVQPVVPPIDSLKLGAVAYYAFNSNVVDSTINLHNGTAYNLATLVDRNQKTNAAYYFNGTSAYIAIPDRTDLRLNNTDFTLNFWIKLDNYSLYGNNVLAKHLNGNDLGWVIGINGTSAAIPGAVHFGPGGSSASAMGTKPIGVNQWHMVTATYKISAQQLSIFVDGVLDNVTNNIPSPNATVASMLYIGRDEPTASTDGYFVKGGIDEVRIYNRLLPVTQIAKLLANKN